MNHHQAIALGAQAGHRAGQHRAGAYIIEEEVLLSWDAAEEAAIHTQGLGNPHIRGSWSFGYRVGYRLAAEGSQLPDHYRNG